MVVNTPSQKVGETIPNNTQHAVSVTLPTWEATVGYEEGEDWVISQLSSGYPRFSIHWTITKLASKIEEVYGRTNERAMIFSSYKVAKLCREFIKDKTLNSNVNIRLLQLGTPAPKTPEESSTKVAATIGVVFYPSNEFPLAKNFWQHSGDGISSRKAEYLWEQLFPGETETTVKGKHISYNGSSKQEMQAKKIQRISPSIRMNKLVQDENLSESDNYIDQKYGRILDLKFAHEAKVALKRRISGNIENSHNTIDKEFETGKELEKLTEEEVYLYPSGMSAIFHAHQALLDILGKKKSVCFGFPYVDTLNILRKFGPGVHFLGLGDDKSLAELEDNLENNVIDIIALFCECPSNPLLKTPNLKKIRQLANKFKFAIVVDETVGNFLNIHVLPYADIVASSLTKLFSGDSNVMAGSLVLNPNSFIYDQLKSYFNKEYEDMFWDHDALVLERNSRDFPQRSAKINDTSLAVVEELQNSPLISKVYYPLISDTKKYYDEVKNPNGGYGGLISFLFHDPMDAVAFFNAVNLHKGPSLGTNFTLACPYTILAHYGELDEVAEWDVDRNLIRISIGIEDKQELISVLQKSLNQAEQQHS